jgi:hypothetical protein
MELLEVYFDIDDIIFDDLSSCVDFGKRPALFIETSKPTLFLLP